jgi:hypothetical protein
MIAILTAFGILNSTAQFNFPLGSETKFNVKVQFDGYIPLFGGKSGKADVDMVVKAISVPEKSRNLQAVDSEIIELKAVAFGSTLPLNKNNIGAFFPKAVATFDSTGLVKFNGAEHKEMPVKLPGLDSQRLPEISYVPLVLNQEAIGEMKPYEFTRTFNGSPLKYKVTPGTIEKNRETFQIEIDQESSSFEDSYGNPIVEEGAKSKLKTVLTGKGTAIFNIEKQMFDKVVVETTGDTEVTVIKSGKTSKRSLRTTLTIVRDGAEVDE